MITSDPFQATRKIFDEALDRGDITYYIVAHGEPVGDTAICSEVVTAGGDTEAILLAMASILQDIAEYEECSPVKLVCQMLDALAKTMPK